MITSRILARLVRLAPACVLFAGVLWMLGCGEKPQEEVDTTAPVPVVVQPVARGDLRREIGGTGVVTPAAGAELVVTAPQSARIAELPHGIGDRVHRGDLLVRFDIPGLESDAASRRADAARASARLAQARSNFDRVQGLFDRGIAARREVEDARRELSDATAGLAESKTAEAGAGDLAGRRTVRAPFDGVVAERRHNPGDLVEPSSEAIVRLIDPTKLEIVAQIPAALAPWLEAGDAAEVRASGDASSARGGGESATLRSPAAAIDPSTSTAAVRLTLAASTKLAAGAAVEVSIAADLHRGVLFVPVAALIQDGGETFVYTVDGESKAHRQKVETGIVTRAAVEIASGLDPGSRVVVEGANGLPDGAKVTLGGAETPAPAESH